MTGALENLAGPTADARVLVARFLNGGAIDTSFGWQGFSLVKVLFSEGRRMARQKDMVIVAALATTPGGASNIILMRYKP